ncbi:MAG: PqqD family protein [Anaerolineae bacterium]
MRVLTAMSTSISARPIQSAGVASRVYGSDAVVISPDEGMVRMLNPTASRIWQLADGSRSVDDIAAVLTEEFMVDLPQARQSVVRLLGELAERQLVTWIDA